MGKAKPSKRSGENGSAKLVSAMKTHLATQLAPALNRVSSSGKITKNKLTEKKSVSFRSNLTDVLAAEHALGTAENIGSKLPKSVSGQGVELLSNSSDSSFRRNLKAQVRVKKVRHLIKREAFRKKIELFQQAEAEKKKAKRRQETVIVGDLNPLMEALSSLIPPESDLGKLETFVAAHKLTEFQTIPKTKKLNMKRREKEIAEGLDYFSTGLKSQ